MIVLQIFKAWYCQTGMPSLFLINVPMAHIFYLAKRVKAFKRITWDLQNHLEQTCDILLSFVFSNSKKRESCTQIKLRTKVLRYLACDCYILQKVCLLVFVCVCPPTLKGTWKIYGIPLMAYAGPWMAYGGRWKAYRGTWIRHMGGNGRHVEEPVSRVSEC